MKQLELPAIPENLDNYLEVEKYIIFLFRREIYIPLITELGVASYVLKNSLADLVDAIVSGRITYYRGHFTGRFNSTLSKELKKIGAKWDRKQGSWSVPQSKLPVDISLAINASQYKLQRVIEKINRHLENLSPAEIAEKMDFNRFFDKTIWKVEKKFEKSISGITIAPKLTEEQVKRMSEEYTKNMQLYIKDWTEKEIIELRKQVTQRSAQGLRYELLMKDIQKSYGVSVNKARFLARQETSLVMTKFKQIRYESAGVKQYRWQCVTGSPNHPVRPMHKALNGKIFSWDSPPVVNEKGERKNPGQDYGCRCTARPIVKF